MSTTTKILLDTKLRHEEIIEAMIAREGAHYVDILMTLVSVVSALRIVNLPEPIATIVAHNLGYLSAEAAGIGENKDKIQEFQTNTTIIMNLLMHAEDELAKATGNG